MKTLKVTNYKGHRGHDGMEGFNCILSYKGVKIAHVHDDAYGGEYDYQLFGKIVERKNGDYINSETRDRSKKLFNELLQEISKLPKKYDEDLDFEFTQTLDGIVDKLCSVERLKKDQAKGVIIKDRSGYSIVGFKTSIPNTIKKWSDGLQAIQNVYDEQVAQGHEVMNKEYLKKTGIKI